MKLIWIRHGKTLGNLQRRYVGRTDEPLCAEGRQELQQLKQAGNYPAVEVVYASPMRRCLETAALLYPQRAIHIIEDYRECDFGRFEYETYETLKIDAAYQAWLDSNGEGEIPEGENAAEFRARCCQGFRQMMADLVQREAKLAAVVVHGGTMMAVLAAFAKVKRPFYDWQAKNGHGYWADVTDWQQTQQMDVYQKY